MKGCNSLISKIFQLLILKENTDAIQRKNMASYLKVDYLKFKSQAKWQTDSSRSTLEYTLLCNNNFSIDNEGGGCPTLFELLK